MVSLAVEVELRLNDVIMPEKKYWFSQKYFCHAAFQELSLIAFFSENNSAR